MSERSVSWGINNVLIFNDLIDEIGEYLGYNMWKSNKYPKSKIEAMGYYNGELVLYQGNYLLIFRPTTRNGKIKSSVYTLNLKTMRPTKASPNQTQLNMDLKRKLRASPGLSPETSNYFSSLDKTNLNVLINDIKI